MQHQQAIGRLRALFNRPERHSEYRAEPDHDPDAFSGPTLLEQEPDLRQESARHGMMTSAAAAGGHPTD